MTSKAKSVKGSSQSIDYIQNDKELGDAIELDRNGIVGQNGEEIWEEFKMIADANKRAENKTISMFISPSDERKFTTDELREIGQRHIKDLGLEKNQYLMTLHQSTGKPHIHIIANRIDSNGKAFKDSHISLKSQRISEKISQEYGLMTAKEIQHVRKLEIQPIKKEIQEAHNFAKNNSKVFSDYKELMNSKGVKVLESINKQGQLQGFKFTHKESGLTFKASEIGKKFGAKDLIMRGVKMPPLSPPLMKISKQVIKQVTKAISRGISR